MRELKNASAIFLAACFGGWLRYEASTIFVFKNQFPWATLLVNYLGVFILIFLVKSYLAHKNLPQGFLLALGTGFCGGLTTFSSLLLDSVKLYEAGNYLGLVCYMFLSIVGGLVIALVAERWGRNVD